MSLFPKEEFTAPGGRRSHESGPAFARLDLELDGAEPDRDNKKKKKKKKIRNLVRKLRDNQGGGERERGRGGRLGLPTAPRV